MSDAPESLPQSVPNCPICGSPGVKVKHLTCEQIERALALYFGSPVASEAVASDYSILRCTTCTLEYSSPLSAGNRQFYRWITGKSGYYPPHRWEWREAIDTIATEHPQRRKVLEVGCGGGTFLRSLVDELSADAMGIDTEPNAIAACASLGIEARCCTAEDLLTSGGASSYDWVVLFHCLEHVEAPLQLIRTLVRLLKPGGRILISTPYSPMSFEDVWFDPLNHPPHHVTRWNAQAYRELARVCGLRIKMRMPTATNALMRAIIARAYAQLGPGNVSRLGLAKVALGSIGTVSRDYFKQLRREQIEGQTVADVILVELQVD